MINIKKIGFAKCFTSNLFANEYIKGKYLRIGYFILSYMYIQINRTYSALCFRRFIIIRYWLVNGDLYDHQFSVTCGKH